MNDTLRTAWEKLRSLGSGSKAVAVLVALAIGGVVAVAGVVANRPHFETLVTGLDDVERAKVLKALSEGAVRFEVSQPPGPYSVYVDAGERHKALMLVAQAGALERAPGGIQAGDGGLSSVWLSAEERQQAVRKREWEETEHMLAALDFVLEARVGTSQTDRSPIRKGEPITASVTLTLRGLRELSANQARTVAQLVRFRLGVEPKNLVIADQSGNSLYDGNALSEPGAQAAAWLEGQQAHDRRLEEEANSLLADVLGSAKAWVKVRSQWNHDQTTTVSERNDPESKVLVSEETESRKQPSPPRTVGGPAGVSSNGAGALGIDNAAVTSGPAASAADQIAKDDTARRRYLIDRVTTSTVRNAPELERLSVALFLDAAVDSGLDDEKRTRLYKSVQAAVGFVEGRDAFEPAVLPFAERPAEPAVANDGSSARLVETLLERGVEIVSALAFLFLLARALKSATKKPAPEEPTEADVPEVEIDPDLLARQKVLDLVANDPAQVARILSAWAGEGRAVAKSGAR